MADDYDVPPLRLPALDPEGRYRLHLPEPWPHKAARYLAHAEQWREGIDLGGRVITERGLALPLAHPETAWLIAVETL
jgi:alpha-galactosidase